MRRRHCSGIALLVTTSALMSAQALTAESRLDRLLVHGNGFVLSVEEPPGWHGDTSNSERFNGMRVLKWLAVAIALAPFCAFADGLPLVDGRYPHGKVTVLTLTADQERFIACVRERHTDNSKTPYVFRLTPSQSAQLKREAGKIPARFQVYETYRGFNDAGPHWNLVLRFSEHQIEIPHGLLLPDREAEHAEFDVQGWAANPSIARMCSGKPRSP
jgi:hypothetical protein